MKFLSKGQRSVIYRDICKKNPKVSNHTHLLFFITQAFMNSVLRHAQSVVEFQHIPKIILSQELRSLLI